MSVEHIARRFFVIISGGIEVHIFYLEGELEDKSRFREKSLYSLCGAKLISNYDFLMLKILLSLQQE